jgi:hypothetical protein
MNATMNYKLFKEYLQAKKLLNDQTMSFYQRVVWRKMKFRQYSSGKKSIDTFLNNIQKTFGDNLVIGYGDWSRTTQMKHSAPSMGKGLRKLIHKRYDTISINESYSSKKCCECYKDLVHHYDKNGTKIYRLLKCMDCTNCSDCVSFENKRIVFRSRDVNAAHNIRMLTHEWIHHQSRPIAFQRPEQIKKSSPGTTLRRKLKKPRSSLG